MFSVRVDYQVKCQDETSDQSMGQEFRSVIGVECRCQVSVLRSKLKVGAQVLNQMSSWNFESIIEGVSRFKC